MNVFTSPGIFQWIAAIAEKFMGTHFTRLAFNLQKRRSLFCCEYCTAHICRWHPWRVMRYSLVPVVAAIFQLLSSITLISTAPSAICAAISLAASCLLEAFACRRLYAPLFIYYQEAVVATFTYAGFPNVVIVGCHVFDQYANENIQSSICLSI